MIDLCVLRNEGEERGRYKVRNSHHARCHRAATTAAAAAASSREIASAQLIPWSRFQFPYLCDHCLAPRIYQ